MKLEKILNELIKKRHLPIKELDILKTKLINDMKNKLEYNRWIKNDDFPKFIIYYDREKNTCYGLNSGGRWFFEGTTSTPDCSNARRYATNQEIEEALTKEAKKRYKIGDIVCCLYDSKEEVLNEFNFIFKENKTFFWVDEFLAFKDGKWAEIIEQPKEETFCESVKDKIKPDYYKVTISNDKGGTIQCDYFDIANALNLTLEQFNTLKYMRKKGDKNKQIHDTKKGITCLKKHLINLEK